MNVSTSKYSGGRQLKVVPLTVDKEGVYKKNDDADAFEPVYITVTEGSLCDKIMKNLPENSKYKNKYISDYDNTKSAEWADYIAQLKLDIVTHTEGIILPFDANKLCNIFKADNEAVKFIILDNAKVGTLNAEGEASITYVYVKNLVEPQEDDTVGGGE